MDNIFPIQHKQDFCKQGEGKRQ